MSGGINVWGDIGKAANVPERGRKEIAPGLRKLPVSEFLKYLFFLTILIFFLHF